MTFEKSRQQSRRQVERRTTERRALNHQFMTQDWLEQIQNRELLEINPIDARVLRIKNGDMVEVSSRRGKLKVEAKTSFRVPKGLVFMTFHFKETPTNVLTNPALDPVAKIPEFKVCAVNINKVM